MSYLNISKAAWSLVLSTDPATRSQPLSLHEREASELEYAAHSSDSKPTHPLPSICSSSDDKQNSFSTANTVSSAKQRHAAAAERSQPASSMAASAALLDPPLPLELRQPTQKASVNAVASSCWCASSGAPAGPWLQQAYGPAWQEATAVAGRASTLAHKAAVAALEQRHAALLKDIGSSRDLTLKRILELVQSFSADVIGQLVSYQQAELLAQQQHLEQVTAAAAAAVSNTIHGAVQAANRKHQEQVKTLEAYTLSQLEACRVAAAREMAAALAQEQQHHTQQNAQQVRETHDAWSSKWEAAQAAAKKQAALLGNAESECKRLRAELATAKQEAQTWRGKWDKECSSGSTNNSSSCPFCSNGTSAAAAFLSKQFSSVRGSTAAAITGTSAAAAAAATATAAGSSAANASCPTGIGTQVCSESGNGEVMSSRRVTIANNGRSPSPLAGLSPQLSPGGVASVGSRGDHSAVPISSNSSARSHHDVRGKRQVLFTPGHST